MKIPQDIVDRIQENIDIVDVIGDFVSLKKKGQNYSACCPFHNEKTPSFNVNPARGIYKCFGCGKAGDAIQFVMDVEGLTFSETLKYLAKKYNIEIEEEEQSSEELQQQNERESLLIVLNYAKNYYHNILLNNEDGRSIGLSYFKERGFSDKTIEKFELGYSLDEWDALLKDATKGNYKQEILEKAGLIVKRENANDSKSTKHYDRFRGRVIFPIHNITGKTIAFGARILKADKNQPKYLNSPETEVYHKSKILYGISQAKNAIRQEDNCLLVEGYTDVISLFQAGVENVVASSGTSLTEDQIKLIKRYTNNVTVLYDGDAAGIKASIRGIDMILQEGLNVSVVTFPDGEDPDSYIRKIGGTEFTSYLKTTRKDFITFKAELFLKDVQNDPLKKAEVAREMVISISKISDSIKREIFIKQSSAILNISEDTLIKEVNKTRLNDSKKQDAHVELIPIEELRTLPQPDENKLSPLELQERDIIRLLLNYAEYLVSDEKKLSQYVLDELEDTEFKSPLYNKMLDIIKQNITTTSNLANVFIHHQDEELKKEAIDLITFKYQLSPHWETKHKIYAEKPEESLENRAYHALVRYKLRAVQQMANENKSELGKATTDEEVQKLLMIQLKLKETEKQLSSILGIVVMR